MTKMIKILSIVSLVMIFISCNTDNRPSIDDTVPGTPTYSDTVLTNHHGHADKKLENKQPLREEFQR